MFTGPSPRRCYHDIVNMILDEGEVVTAHGSRTLEIVGATLHFNRDVTDAVIARPGYNPAIGAVEALQLISGLAYPQANVKATANMAQFMDGGVFSGAYGPRIRPQLWPIIEMLMRDPGSRQAILNIWDPRYDLQPDVQDRPCTMSIQFLIRNDKLNMCVHMRSNDIWWGFTYDAFQFTQLQLFVAAVLNVRVGSYTHFVGSLHLYERDWVQAERITSVQETLEQPSPNTSLIAPDILSRDDFNKTHSFDRMQRDFEQGRLLAKMLLDEYVEDHPRTLAMLAINAEAKNTRVFDWYCNALSLPNPND